jgi:uncharacterized protein (UPF0297 family)
MIYFIYAEICGILEERMNENKLTLEQLEDVVEKVYVAMLEKNYDPSIQLAGYILSEDPLYMPDHNNARGLIRQVDRDELLQLVIDYYLQHRFGSIDENKNN